MTVKAVEKYLGACTNLVTGRCDLEETVIFKLDIERGLNQMKPWKRDALLLLAQGHTKVFTAEVLGRGERSIYRLVA